MSEKEKQKILEQINNLTLMEFSKLCLRVVKKIVNREPVEKTIENHIEKPDIDVLIKLMIENDVKTNDDKE